MLDQGFASGLLAQGYGRVDAPRRVDAALELTVAGLTRIAAAGPLGIPVLNLARSQVKTRLGYPEIADSCLRRLRQASSCQRTRSSAEPSCWSDSADVLGALRSEVAQAAPLRLGFRTVEPRPAHLRQPGR